MSSSHHDTAQPATRAKVRLTGITKSFPGVVALRDVSMTVLAGEVHALVGENGAGKSTLMGIAAGSVQPDTGSIEIDGNAIAHLTPSVALGLGLGIVRQDPALLPDLTVGENMFLGIRPRLPGGGRAVNPWAAALLEPWEMGIDARSRIREITVEQRFIVEIAKALALQPSILILDEPTEHLNVDEVERLFVAVRGVAARGGAVVYISHRIPEVKRIADRLTVLRDGQVRGTFAAADVSEAEIVNLVVGRSLDVVFPVKPVDPDAHAPVMLRTVGLTGHRFTGVDLQVRAGEVVGLAGIQGNGQQELIRALAGMAPSSGELEIGGNQVRRRHPAGLRRMGVAYIPADRQGEGLLMPLSVRENIGIGSIDDFATFGVVHDRQLTGVVKRQVAALSVKAPGLSTPVRVLSGGNQQKVVLGRGLLSDPKVLLAEEPTQGVDAGARVEIYRIVRNAAASGAGVVVLSSDGIELAGLCDRVLIVSRGHVVRELTGDELSERNIAEAALTATHMRSRAATTQRRERLLRFARGDYAPPAVLAGAIVALAGFVLARNGDFLNSINLNGMLLLLAALGFVSMGQLVALLTGGIDLSVGPLTGFLVIVASYFVVDGSAPGRTLLGFTAMVFAAVAVGLVNGSLVRFLNVNPVVATLAMFMALRGISLTLRTTPSGAIRRDVATSVEFSIGFVPVAFIAVVLLALALEAALRWSRWGLELRAVGSRADAAARIGIDVGRTRLAAYILCSLLVVAGAVMLMAQIGIGDPNAGVDYTLASITAVVLGGTSIFGGRGSFVATLLGAALIQEITNATTFLQLDQSWQYWLLAILTLAAAASYSKIRSLGQAS